MDRALDQLMDEVARMENDLQEMRHRYEVNCKWCEDFRIALELSCEHHLASADLFFFSLNEDEQKEKIRHLCYEYIIKAQEGAKIGNISKSRDRRGLRNSRNRKHK